MEPDPRISIGEPRDDRGNEPIYEWPGAANPQFADRWIRQERNLLHSPSQVIEYRGAAIQQRAAIGSCRDALRGAIKQTDAERMFQVRDRFRHNRLGNRELLRRTPHASGFCQRNQDVQIAQFYAALDAIDPSHDSDP